jgi:dGTPase
MNELAPYAASPERSRGRRFEEPPAQGRSIFQRDRDRIVHSTAFRRLEYKTQVFVNHEGDHFRTRLTHSIEVAQIARSVARRLRLDEDLTEAIALAHDLGHTPFGHAGQDALNDCMRDHGGFEHNLQSLRVVDVLEQRYAAFDGLNLCFETREGILKHCSLRNARLLGDVGERFLKGHSPSLEAQVANLADEIAYNNHDIDDGVRSGLLRMEQLEMLPIVARHMHAIRTRYPGIAERRLVHETVRGIVNALVADLVEHSVNKIVHMAPQSIDDVRTSPPLIEFGGECRAELQTLKDFLLANLYRHYRVNRMAAKARRVVRELFLAFSEDPRLLPEDFYQQSRREGARAVADYIAGMTDRYALREHKRLFAIEED